MLPGSWNSICSGVVNPYKSPWRNLQLKFLAANFKQVLDWSCGHIVAEVVVAHGDRWPIWSNNWWWFVPQSEYADSELLVHIVGIHKKHALLVWGTRAPSQCKDRLSRYSNSCYKDETVIRPPCLHDGNLYTGKTPSLYWTAPWISTPLREGTKKSFHDLSSILLPIHTFLRDIGVQATKYLYRSFVCLSLTFAWVRVFGSKNRVTLVSLTHMRKPNASCCCPTRATCFIRDTLVFVRAPSDLLTTISNENRELSHTTPNATTMTPEAATLATLVLPINWRVSRVA